MNLKAGIIWTAVLLSPTLSILATPVRQLPGLVSVTYHERTGGVAPTAWTFAVNDPRMTARLEDPLTAANNDFFGVPNREFYDVFYSDVDGLPNPEGEYLTIEGVFDATAPDGGALNLAEIALNFSGSGDEYGLFVASFLALGDNAVPTGVFHCIDGNLQTHTTMGNTVDQTRRMRITLGFQSSSGPAVGANLALIKNATSVPLTVTNDLVYTLTVLNLRPVTNTHAVVTDELPVKVDFLSAVPSQGSCTESNGIVTCDLGDLPPETAATITVTVTPNRTGTITNSATVVASEPDELPADNTDHVVTRLVQLGENDLTAEFVTDFAECVSGAKGPLCPISAQLVLRNNDYVYGYAVASLTNSCRTTKIPATCTIKGVLTVNELDLTALPDHTLALYLSADDILDAGDFLMYSVRLSKPLKSFLKNKPIKLSLKLPKGVELTGQRILVMVDAPDKKGFDAVLETDEDNNTAASEPIPPLP